MIALIFSPFYFHIDTYAAMPLRAIIDFAAISHAIYATLFLRCHFAIDFRHDCQLHLIRLSSPEELAASFRHFAIAPLILLDDATPLMPRQLLAISPALRLLLSNPPAG